MIYEILIKFHEWGYTPFKKRLKFSKMSEVKSRFFCQKGSTDFQTQNLERDKNDIVDWLYLVQVEPGHVRREGEDVVRIQQGLHPQKASRCAGACHRQQSYFGPGIPLAVIFL